VNLIDRNAKTCETTPGWGKRFYVVIAAVLVAVTVPVRSAIAAGTEDDPPTSTTPAGSGSAAPTSSAPPPYSAGSNSAASNPAAPTAVTAPKSQGASDHYETAKLHIAKGEWTAAVSELEQANRLQPDNADINNLLGYSSRKLGKLDVSLKYYQKALKITPKHLGANEYLGELYLMMKLPVKAKAQLATLAKICGKTCEEYLDLKKAIDGYKAPKRK